MVGDNIKIYEEGYNRLVVDSFAPKPWKPSKEIEDIVEQKWKELISKKPHVTSDPLIRLDRMYWKGKSLHLLTSSTEYKFHFGTRPNQKKEDRADPVYVSALVISHGKLVFGQRSSFVSRGENQYNIVAGGVNPIIDRNPDTGRPALALGLFREAREELGLTPEVFDYVSTIMLFGLEHEPTGSFLYAIRLNIGTDDLQRRLESAIKIAEKRGQQPPEMVGLEFVDYNKFGIRDALEMNGDNYRPSVRALFKHYSKDDVPLPLIT